MTRTLGPLMTDWPLRRLVERIVRQYTGIYADEIARQQRALGSPMEGIGADDRVKRIRSVVVRERAVRLPEEQLPGIVIALPGTLDDRYRDGDGVYSCTRRLEIHSAVASSRPAVGGELASVLAHAAAKALLDGLPGELGDRIGSVGWVGSGDAELETDAGQRSLHTSVHVLEVGLLNVISDGGQLPELPGDDELTDPGDLPLVEETGTTTTPVEEIDP